MAKPLDEEKIRECVNKLLAAAAGPADVVGPALGVLVTELAVADGMDIETLVSLIRAQHAVATGAMFRKGGEEAARAPQERGPSSLGTALPAEMARVRDEMIPMYESIGPPGTFALALMRQELDTATQALAEGDVVQMLKSYEALKGFNE